jgi:DHA1 family chloramphenicol resistance protein-like MFS transporter
MPFPLYMLALAIFVMGTSEFMISGLLPQVAADLDVSVGTAGLLTSAFAAGMVVGAPLMAAFARLWTRRTVLLVCLMIFAGAHVVGATTPTFWILLLTRLIGALANAGFLSVAMSTATTLVASDRVGGGVRVALRDHARHRGGCPGRCVARWTCRLARHLPRGGHLVPARADRHLAWGAAQGPGRRH